MKNAFSILKEDHKLVKKLFSEIVDKENFDEEKIQTLCEALTDHTELEEKWFYPAVEDKLEESDLVEEAYLEHKNAKNLIKKLETKDLEDVELKVTLENLKLMIEHHIEEEEKELFPAVEENLSEEDLDEISKDVAENHVAPMASSERA